MRYKTVGGDLLSWDGRGCTAVIDAYIFPTHCLRPAAGWVTLACVHEHLHRCPVCDRCLDLMRAEDAIACHQCKGCAEPHECGMKIVRWEAWEDAAESGSGAPPKPNEEAGHEVHP